MINMLLCLYYYGAVIRILLFKFMYLYNHIYFAGVTNDELFILSEAHSWIWNKSKFIKLVIFLFELFLNNFYETK